MITKRKGYSIRLGYLLAAITCIVLTAKASKASSQEAHVCPRDKAEILHRLRATQIDSSGTKFELGDGLTLSLFCEGQRLVTAQVTMDDSRINNNVPNNDALVSESSHCCMSKSTYNKLVGIINKLEPIGFFEREKSIGIIRPTGFVQKTSEFAYANIVRLESTHSTSKSNNTIAAFTVFYWVPLNGQVQSKRIETIDVKPLIKKVRYWITVRDIEVEISSMNYRRIKVGQIVKLKTTANNNLAKIVSITN